MKKMLIFFSVLLSFSTISQAQCDSCAIDTTTIQYIGNHQYQAASAQAYFWEICQGGATITGSNKEQKVTVNCGDTSGLSTLRLTRFQNGQCLKSCVKVKCDTIPRDTCKCDRFRDSCLTLSVTPDCSALTASMICSDTLCIDSIKWTVTLDTFIVNFTTIGNPHSIHWAMPNSNDLTNKELCVRVRIYLKGGQVCQLIKCIRLRCLFLHGALDQKTSGGGSVSLFPNPIEKGGVLGLSTKLFDADSAMEIYNAQGQLVQKIGPATDRIALDGRLETGVYYLKINKNQQTDTYKFIVK